MIARKRRNSRQSQFSADSKETSQIPMISVDIIILVLWQALYTHGTTSYQCYRLSHVSWYSLRRLASCILTIFMYPRHQTRYVINLILKQIKKQARSTMIHVHVTTRMMLNAVKPTLTLLAKLDYSQQKIIIRNLFATN